MKDLTKYIPYSTYEYELEMFKLLGSIVDEIEHSVSILSVVCGIACLEVLNDIMTLQERTKQKTIKVNDRIIGVNHAPSFDDISATGERVRGTMFPISSYTMHIYAGDEIIQIIKLER